ncbi:hypothetical protein BGZ58_001069 [Dissophora ornata]|nr:hypothetical protein BGZ58_001069 [Dissophora ornata]
MSQNDLAVAHDSTDFTTTNTNTSSAANSNTLERFTNSKTARADSGIETTALLLDKPLPASPLPGPPAVPEKDILPGRAILISSPKRASVMLAPNSPPQNGFQKSAVAKNTRTSSLSQQSIHSQSSISNKSINSSNSSGSRSDGSTRATATSTPTTSVTGGTTESLGQLSLQRFPTGESEYKTLPMSRSKTADHPSRHSHETNVLKASRTTSTVSSSSARSSSGSSGFKFPKPNLFKPLLYSQGNDSKNQQQQHVYQYHTTSSPATVSEGHHRHHHHHHHHHHQGSDPSAYSPFPLILQSIELPQSLLDKYVIDLDSFRHGKGIWGIGRYSWTVTVLSKSTGKKYVVKKVSKSLLPPSAYYHYPTTAHRLCTCPACKSSREQLLLTGQLDQKELDNMREVLIIENQGNRKELPQQKRPTSASSISSNTPKDVKDKRNSPNLYSNYNSSMPNQQGKFLSFSSSSSPQTSPVNSRPSTPSPSPLRLSSTPTASMPAPKSPNSIKVHNRSQSHNTAAVQNALAPSPLHSPLLPSATLPSWPQKDRDLTVPQTISKQLDRRPHSPNTRSPMGISSEYVSAALPTKPVPRSTGASYSRNKRPTLRRHKSTPNLSRTVTGLDVLEDDPRRRQRFQYEDTRPSILEAGRRLFDSPLTTTFTMPSMHLVVAGKGYLNESSDSDSVDSGRPRSPPNAPIKERKVSPFDTNEGEFKRMEPESVRTSKNPEPRGFIPPPHALPMELVLLQTYNDSDHLPEHFEWTQDKDFWYYVTKAHGVKRRKLKKVSTWWLEVGSLGNVLMPGSSSVNEPIATGPIYSMGRGTGNMTPTASSPLSSEVALPRTSLSMDQANSNMSYSSSFSTVKRQSSPRNSHMGKYYYVDWDEYTSL